MKIENLAARARMRLEVGRARRAAGIACLVGLLVGVASVGSTSASAKTAKDPTLTIGVSTAPISYNPAKVDSDPFDEMAMSLMYAPLIHQNPNGSFSAGLAKSWRYLGSGNKTFELTLRKGAAFSDGTPVTAQAVKNWLLYYSKVHVNALIAISSISTTGRWKVVIHLKAANPLVATVLSETDVEGYLASSKAVANPSLFANHGYGAGAYEIDRSATITGSKYTYVPNPHYYDQAAIRFSKVVLDVISTPASMLAAVKTGQVQVAQGDSTTAKQAKAAGIPVVAKPTSDAAFVFLDMAGKTVPALSNVKVRQALNYAINRRQITKALLGAYGQPTSEYLTSNGFNPKYQNYYPYDPAKAKALLAAAGYPNGFSMTLLSDTFEGVLGDPITQAVAQDLDNIGVKATVQGEPSATAYSAAISGCTYPAFELDYGGDDVATHYEYFLSPQAGCNNKGFDDTTLDGLFSASQTASPKQASTDWLKMSDREVTQAEMLPVSEVDTIWYVSKKIGGFAFSGAEVNPYPTEWFEK